MDTGRPGDLDDGVGTPVQYRPLRSTDDLGAVTEILHAAYRPLAEAGMRLVASYQDVDTTRKRVSAGETLVATVGDRIIGIITWMEPGTKEGCVHYARPDVATFGQFAVDPAYQGRGSWSSSKNAFGPLAPPSSPSIHPSMPLA